MRAKEACRKADEVELLHRDPLLHDKLPLEHSGFIIIRPSVIAA